MTVTKISASLRLGMFRQRRFLSQEIIQTIGQPLLPLGAWEVLACLAQSSLMKKLPTRVFCTKEQEVAVALFSTRGPLEPAFSLHHNVAPAPSGNALIPPIPRLLPYVLVRRGRGAGCGAFPSASFGRPVLGQKKLHRWHVTILGPGAYACGGVLCGGARPPGARGWLSGPPTCRCLPFLPSRGWDRRPFWVVREHSFKIADSGGICCPLVLCGDRRPRLGFTAWPRAHLHSAVAGLA